MENKSDIDLPEEWDVVPVDCATPYVPAVVTTSSVKTVAATSSIDAIQSETDSVVPNITTVKANVTPTVQKVDENRKADSSDKEKLLMAARESYLSHMQDRLREHLLELQKQNFVTEKQSHLNEVKEKREEFNHNFKQTAKENLEQKLESRKENRESHNITMQELVSEIMQSIDKNRKADSPDKGEKLQAINKKLMTAQEERESHFSYMQDRLKQHMQNIDENRKVDSPDKGEKLQATNKKLMTAQEQQESHFSYMQDRLREHPLELQKQNFVTEKLSHLNEVKEKREEFNHNFKQTAKENLETKLDSRKENMESHIKTLQEMVRGISLELQREGFVTEKLFYLNDVQKKMEEFYHNFKQTANANLDQELESMKQIRESHIKTIQEKARAIRLELQKQNFVTEKLSHLNEVKEKREQFNHKFKQTAKENLETKLESRKENRESHIKTLQEIVKGISLELQRQSFVTEKLFHPNDVQEFNHNIKQTAKENLEQKLESMKEIRESHVKTIQEKAREIETAYVPAVVATSSVETIAVTPSIDAIQSEKVSDTCSGESVTASEANGSIPPDPKEIKCKPKNSKTSNYRIMKLLRSDSFWLFLLAILLARFLCINIISNYETNINKLCQKGDVASQMEEMINELRNDIKLLKFHVLSETTEMNHTLYDVIQVVERFMHRSKNTEHRNFLDVICEYYNEFKDEDLAFYQKLLKRIACGHYSYSP